MVLKLGLSFPGIFLLFSCLYRGNRDKKNYFKDLKENDKQSQFCFWFFFGGGGYDRLLNEKLHKLTNNIEYIKFATSK